MGLTHWILSGHASLGCAMNLPTPLMAPVDISSRRSPPSAKAPSRAPSPPPGSLPPLPNVPFSSPPLVSGPIARTFQSQPPKRFRPLSTGYPRAAPPSFQLPTGSPFKTSAPSLSPQSRAPSGDLSLALHTGPVGTYMTAPLITGLISLPAPAPLPPLRPSRLNGSILHNHFVPWKTPPTLHQDFQCAVQVLSELLLTSFLHDPNDLGYASSDTYRLTIAGHPSVLPQRRPPSVLHPQRLV